MGQLFLVLDNLGCKAAIVVRMEGRLVEVFVLWIASLAASVSSEMCSDVDEVCIRQDAWYQGERQAYPAKAS